MSKAMKNMVILVGLLVIALGIILYLYVQEAEEEQRQYKSFLNHFYVSVDRSLGRIQYLTEEKPENDGLDEVIRLLEKDLLKTNTIMQSGDAFLNHNIDYTAFFRKSTYFLYGLKLSSNGSVIAKIPPLAKDGKLDNREITLLKTIEKHLKAVEQAMYSPKTRQEDPNLTLNEFNEIIRKHVSKNEFEIYQEAFK